MGVKRHLLFQRRVETAVGFVSGVVNAFSFGVGGSMIKADGDRITIIT